jgi:hypothetical protein
MDADFYSIGGQTKVVLLSEPGYKFFYDFFCKIRDLENYFIFGLAKAFPDLL